MALRPHAPCPIRKPVTNMSFSGRGFLASSAFAPAFNAAPSARPPALQCRTLGRTSLKPSTAGFGFMIASHPSVVARAVGTRPSSVIARSCLGSPPATSRFCI
ncbi:MAG: hypothetical protein C0504_02615 [Candidatus Solibacter sp.]|nr:hypothetical protein [Candidatus Solibacter sp.]